MSTYKSIAWRWILSTILLCVILALISCQDPINGDTLGTDIETQPSTGMGYLYMTPTDSEGAVLNNVQTDNARSVVPDYSIFDYCVIQLVPTTMNTPFGPVTYNYDGKPKEVFPGAYTVYAYLYSSPEDTQAIATGCVDTIVIEAGKSTYATVTLKLVELTGDHSGNGTFSWINPTEEIMSVLQRAEICVFRNNDVVAKLDMLSSASVITLPVGYYQLRAMFETILGAKSIWVESLSVYKNATSTWNLSILSGEHFFAEPGNSNITWRLDIGKEPAFLTSIQDVEPNSVITFEIEDGNYTNVGFFLDGNLVQSGTSLFYTLHTNFLLPGSHEMAVIIKGQDNIPKSTAVRFKVQLRPQLALQNFAKEITVGNKSVIVNDSAIDKDENIYAVGYTKATNDTGVLVKLDQEGNVLWHISPNETNGKSYLYGIALYEGDIYIVGNYTGTMTFYSNTISGTSTIENPFIARFNSEGGLVWIKTSISGTSYGGWNCIAVGEEGVFVAGMFYYERDLGNGVSVTSNSWANYDSPWIVRYSHEGMPMYAITSSQNRCANVSSLALNNGILAAVGYTNGSGNSAFHFGDLPVLHGVGYNFNGYMAAFEALTGNALWNVLAPVNGSSCLDGVDIVNGYIFASGFEDPSPYILYDDSNNKGIVLKYNTHGSLIWSSTHVSRSRFHKVKVDNSGVYVVGYQNFGIKQSVFHTLDNASGNFISTKTVIGNAESWFNNITFSNQSIVFVGVQKGTSDFTYDGIPQSVKGNSTAENGVIVRLAK